MSMSCGRLSWLSAFQRSSLLTCISYCIHTTLASWYS